MLNKFNFEIAKLAADPEENPNLAGVLVCPNKTAVTDGHLVIEVSGYASEKNLLPFEGIVDQQEFEPFVLPAEEALIFSKAFKKSEAKGANDVLIEPDNGHGAAAFGLKQIGAEKIFRAQKPAGSFPTYENVFLETGQEIASAILSLDLLIPLLQELRKVCDPKGFRTVTIRIFDNGAAPVRFDVENSLVQQTARAALMPAI